MEKLTFGIQIIIGIILIIIANVLSLVLHNGIFSNISWVIYGLLFIIYSGSVVKTNFYAIYNESGECMFFS